MIGQAGLNRIPDPGDRLRSRLDAAVDPGTADEYRVIDILDTCRVIEHTVAARHWSFAFLERVAELVDTFAGCVDPEALGIDQVSFIAHQVP